MSILLNADSYKASHYLQYPDGTEYISSYIEARSDKSYTYSVFFGLQMILDKLKCPTIPEVIQANEILTSHGFEFNLKGWLDIAALGYLPIRIQAVKEGLIVPNHNVLVQVINTDPRFPWLTSFVETMLLRIWYPITVATRSKFIKNIILQSLYETGDPSLINFKLHDFGFRGVSSEESGKIGGTAHLVNFMGTDTLGALVTAREVYGETMAGFSIPAAEHSTITSWGKNSEFQAYENMLDKFAKPGRLVAVVSDSYDLMYAVKHIWGYALKDKILESGATLVVRPDSGDPTLIPLEVIEQLARDFGTVTNDKGYKVLPSCIRVIQGDGVNERSIKECLENINVEGFSTDNITFGMGGELLQTVNRDTLGFAMKASAKKDASGFWGDIYKAPKTDPNKVSKKGRLALIKDEDGFKTVPEIEVGKNKNLLEDVWIDGKTLRTQTLANIRELSNQ